MSTPDASTHALLQVIELPRNGANRYIRHRMTPRLIYTDGYEQVADLVGAYWLLDVLGTEAVPALLRSFELDERALGMLDITVTDKHECTITMTTADDAPPIWSKRIDYTTWPVGEWLLFLGVDDVIEPGKRNVVLSLPNEN